MSVDEREQQIQSQINRDLKEIAHDVQEIERLEAEEEHIRHKHPHPGLVTITVDNKKKEIEPGEYVVLALKEKVGVPASYELEEVKGGTLVPLDDNSRIRICGGEVFISHVRRGGSSHGD